MRNIGTPFPQRLPNTVAFGVRSLKRCEMGVYGGGEGVGLGGCETKDRVNLARIKFLYDRFSNVQLVAFNKL